MAKKILNSDKFIFILGFLIAFSTLILPNFGLGIFGINFEDLPFLIIICFLISHLLINKSLTTLSDSRIWLGLITVFILFGLISSASSFFNPINLRFIVYIFFGYLIYTYSSFTTNKDKLVRSLFLPISLVSVANFIVYITEYTSADNNNGWIPSNIWPSNLLNSGRLAGIQGGGPNVLGALLGLSTLVLIYYYIKTNELKLKIIYITILFISIFCLFLTFSRGSYVAILLSLIIFLYLESKNLKIVLISSSICLTLGGLFLYFGDSQIILKDSDRALLSDIAFNNLDIFQGVGGGRYLTDIYGSYLLALDPELVEEQYNISVNQISSGIIPEGYQGKGNFIIASSGGGYEVLQAANIADKCTGNRKTCQNSRVTVESLIKFFSIVKDIEHKNLDGLFLESECIPQQDPDYLVSRGEYACLNHYINNEYLGLSSNLHTRFIDSSEEENSHFASLINDSLFKQCEEKDFEKVNLFDVTFGCPSRKLAIGELAALTEDLTLRYEKVTFEEFTKYCEGCDLREVKGWLKVEFDKYDKILPRSVFRFYTSKNGEDWEQLGYDHTPGFVVDFNNNIGVVEIGGWVDGQSFGNTWLGAEVSEVIINTKGNTKKVKFIPENINKSYKVYEVASKEEFNSNVSFSDFGIVMYNPTKYWVSVENEDYNFNDDFEISLHLKVPEIIWEEAVLVSLTSGFNGQTASWKWIADDGRLFFSWANSSGEFKNLIGDRSLRSGLLYADDSYFSSGDAPTVDSAHLSQLTTAHNGFLTFAVEYGLVLSVLLFAFFIYSIRIGVTSKSDESNLLVTLMCFLILQNFTNDLIYAPDIAIYIWIIVGVLHSLRKELIQ